MTLYTDTGLEIYDEITKAKVRWLLAAERLPHLAQKLNSRRLAGLLPFRSGEGDITDPWRRDCELVAPIQLS
jgi:hypothetical protein